MRIKGTIVEWNDARGFGFIEPTGGGGRAFCHVSQFADRSRRPSLGDRVTYEVGSDKQGRQRAVQIRAAGTRSPGRNDRRAPTTTPWAAVTGSSIFLLVVVGLVVMGRIPWPVPVAYVIVSGITLLVFAFDKSAAMNRRWRTQESTLHLLALAGGWPGGWIAQSLFRHKTKKTSFTVAFVTCAVINVAALAWAAIDPRGPLGTLLWKIG